MKSRIGTAFLLLAGLVVPGYALDSLAVQVWAAMQAREPALGLVSHATATRQAVVRGLLGGFRAVAADFLWLRMSEAEEEGDLPATESLLDLVTEIDPRPLYFWVNRARITAYDMPGWRIVVAGGYDRVPVEVQTGIIHEQAWRALQQLERARQFHPASAALWIERANIELNRLGDPAAAAESYRQAWAQPGAPYYAARLYAELLRRMDRKADALAWLVNLHPQLPPGNEAADAELVLARIRELERELKVAEDGKFRSRGRAGL